MVGRQRCKAPLPELDTPKLRWLRQSFEAAQYQFIQTELDLAISFCEIAASTSDPQRSRRSKMHAEKARAAAKHLLGEDRLSREMRREIQVKMARLERLLSELREV